MARTPQLLVVTGAESSGKSTLAEALAHELNAPLVPEAARAYLNAKATSDYGPDDLRAIARQQARQEQLALTRGTADVVVADTDQRVIDLWWQEKYPTRVSNFEHTVSAAEVERCYLLCYPDLPWEADPLRENPHDRLRLFAAQLQALLAAKARFRVIWGVGRLRTERALHYARQQLSS